MFSQACVKNSVHGGTGMAGACMAGGVCMEEGMCVAGEIVTAADGTHPTRMHSCLLKFQSKNIMQFHSNGYF